MELWIRSQDKKQLLKCEALLIERVGNNRFGIRAFTKNYDFNIANYETKERALEVLDEIQQLLKGLYMQYSGTATISTETNQLIYEMPKE